MLHFFSERSIIELDEKHVQKLTSSTKLEDELLMAKEEKALENIRKLEVISALSRSKQLPAGFEICMCDALQVISMIM